MTDKEACIAVIQEVASRAEKGDLFCVQVLGAMAFIFMGGGDDRPDDEIDAEIDEIADNVIELFGRAA